MLGYETQAVNSQLVNVAPGQAFAPLTFGSMYTGPGNWPRNGVFNTPPVLPSTQMAGGEAMSGLSGGVGGAGGHPMPTAGTITQTGKTNYFSLKKSPLPWALGFLIIGLGMLHYIHYGKKS